MVKLLGGNPLLGVLLGVALLAAGLVTHRPVLAVAGGFVGVVSAARLLTGARRGDRPRS
ncbi:MAG TPA: hypothetical protein VE343_12620 [Streptosporangiaceae bacterium]|jgi:succinate-acetate transporter protein|nr:hypothetical protein [Streptosporangiaceae bacterium]